MRGVSCAQLGGGIALQAGKSGAMPTEMLATSRADQQIAKLTRKHARAFDAFVNDLDRAGRGFSWSAHMMIRIPS